MGTSGKVALVASAAAAFIVLLALAQPARAEFMCSFPPEHVLQNVGRVRVNVENGPTIGSAVHIRNDEWATAAHVLKNKYSMYITSENAKPGANKHNTIMERKLNSTTDSGYFRAGMIPPYPLTQFGRPPKRGTKVWAVGYAIGQGLMITEGRVMGINKRTGWITHTAASISGMSGGALLSCYENEWTLVGINAAIAQVPARNKHGIVIPVPVPVLSYASTLPQLSQLVKSKVRK